MKIYIASTNPVKINAVHQGFELYFPGNDLEITGVAVSSGVKDQPMRETETLKGAIQRTVGAQEKFPAGDYWVGIEGGIEIKKNEMEAFAWVYILSKDGKAGKGRTGTFFLPTKIIELIKQGKELGEADDIVFNQVNSKQKQGTVGTLTKNVIDRTEYYKQAVIFALIPFINPELY